MSVVIETTLGDITVDLFINERPRACLNFLKLCKIKYYNFNLFHTVSRRFIAQTGDPTGSRNGGDSIFGVVDGTLKRFFVAETNPRIKHTVKGLISFVGNEENMIGSQFFFTLGDDLTYLDGKHCVFGEVAEGLDVLEIINEAICDNDDRPYQDIRITHTVVLDDPLPDLDRMFIPSRSPSPSAERLQGGRIAPDEEIDEIAGKSAQEINEMIAEREAKARATILEMVGDLPDADMAPPENVLFVCKLNPVTTDDDLEIIFSRFGKIKSCEVIRDHKTGDSLQYAFIEFEEKKSCEDAYFKMDNVLIDDRRIHVDFSQSVSKVKWMGKGRGVKHFPENGNKATKDLQEDKQKRYNKNRKNYREDRRSRSRSPEKKRRDRKDLSASPEPKRKKNRKDRQSRSSSIEYRRRSNKYVSESRNENRYIKRSRSTSPKYKRKARYPEHKKRNESNRRSRTPSPVSKKNRRRKSRSRSRSRNERPEIIKSKSYKRTHSSDRERNRRRSRSFETKYKKSSKHTRNRSSSPDLKKMKNKKMKARKRSTSSSSSSSSSSSDSSVPRKSKHRKNR